MVPVEHQEVNAPAAQSLLFAMDAGHQLVPGADVGTPGGVDHGYSSYSCSHILSISQQPFP